MDIIKAERVAAPVPAHGGGGVSGRAVVLGVMLGGIAVVLALAVAGKVEIPFLGGPRNAGADLASAADTVAGVVADTAVVVPADTTVAPAGALPLPPTPAPVPVEPYRAPESPPGLTADQRVRLHRTALEQAIIRADTAQIQAMRRLEGSLLADGFTGDALAEELAGLESLRNNGMHKAARLLAVEWIAFWVREDEREATVTFTETWTSQIHENGTDRCLGNYPPHPVPQAATLRRVNGRWMVSSTTYYSESIAAEAC